MRNLVCILTFIAFLVPCELRAQRPQVETGAAEELVVDWLDRLNALDDWHLTPEGEEVGLEEVIDDMMELFAPDVLSELTPYDDEQIGAIVLRGTGPLRKWVGMLARTQVRMQYIQTRQTAEEYQGIELVYSVELPWGGLGVAVPIIAAYSLREDRERYGAPGMLVLQTNDEGKIQRFRLYLEEKFHVSAI
jgi:hypothetical protein